MLNQKSKRNELRKGKELVFNYLDKEFRNTESTDTLCSAYMVEETYGLGMPESSVLFIEFFQTCVSSKGTFEISIDSSKLNLQVLSALGPIDNIFFIPE